MSIPFSAPFAAPTRMAVGVAMPMAQGQATITTAMKAVSAKPKLEPAKKYHPMKAAVAIMRTAGTK